MEKKNKSWLYLFKIIPPSFWKEIERKVKSCVEKNSTDFIQSISAQKFSEILVKDIHKKLKDQKYIKFFKFSFTQDSFGDMCLLVSDIVNKNISLTFSCRKEGGLEYLRRQLTNVFVENIDSFIKLKT